MARVDSAFGREDALTVERGGVTADVAQVTPLLVDLVSRSFLKERGEPKSVGNDIVGSLEKKKGKN